MPTTQMSALPKRRSKNINIIFLALLAALTCSVLLTSVTYAEGEVVQIKDKTLYNALKNCPNIPDNDTSLFKFEYKCEGFETAEYDDATQTITFPEYTYRAISLPYQGLTDVSDLGKIPSLRKANLSYNNITSFDLSPGDIEELAGMLSYWDLKWNLSHNKIEHIFGIEKEGFCVRWEAALNRKCDDDFYDQLIFYYSAFFGQDIEKEIETSHYEFPNIVDLLNSNRICMHQYSWVRKPFNQIYSIYLENAKLSSDKKSVDILDKNKTAIVSYRMSWEDYREYFETIYYSDDWTEEGWNYYRKLREPSWGDEGYINLFTIKLNYRGEDTLDTTAEPNEQQAQNPDTSDINPAAPIAIIAVAMLGFRLISFKRRA